MTTKFCCVKMATAVDDDNIVMHQGRYYAHGCPRFVSGRSGQLEDATTEFEIDYCPFCGENIPQYCAD